MNQYILIAFLLSLAYFAFGVDKYLFARKINLINRKILEEFSKSALHEDTNAIDFTEKIEGLLSSDISTGMISDLNLDSSDGRNISISYTIKQNVRKALISYDLIRIKN